MKFYNESLLLSPKALKNIAPNTKESLQLSSGSPHSPSPCANRCDTVLRTCIGRQVYGKQSAYCNSLNSPNDPGVYDIEKKAWRVRIIDSLRITGFKVTVGAGWHGQGSMAWILLFFILGID